MCLSRLENIVDSVQGWSFYDFLNTIFDKYKAKTQKTEN